MPLLERRMFEFSAHEGPSIVPLFKTDGQVADIHDFTDFTDLSPDLVDTVHRGFHSTVEHHLREQQAWLRAHPSATPGPVTAQIGVIILERGPGGEVTAIERIDGTGTARRRAP